jgi:uncharacterized protein
MTKRTKPADINATIADLDWARIGAELDASGVAMAGVVLEPAACAALAGRYADEALFRSRIVMARHGFGAGEYKYFDYPLPEPVGALRAALYPRLADVANRWAGALGTPTFPETLEGMLARCHGAGQTKPTPLMLSYGAGDYNCLHQDLYGAHVFPLQVVVLLSEPGRDFDGGEFVVVEQRPRMQSRAEVVSLRQGEAAVFAVRERPKQGSKGFYRVRREGDSMAGKTLGKNLGLIGGLGVGATVLYYEGITAGCATRGVIPQMNMAHANAPTALAFVQAGQIDAFAAYLANFSDRLAAAGSDFLVIPAITPHICLPQLTTLTRLPIIDALDVTVRAIEARGLKRVALFGTRFVIEQRLFGRLEHVEQVLPRPDELEDIHRIYIEIATTGKAAAESEARVRGLAHTMCQREGAEAIVLAGTDFNLVFKPANTDFPVVDCAAAHIAAIVERMAG